MIKKFLFIIILFTSSLVYAEGSYKQKAFGTFTIRLDNQKNVFAITNTEDKTLVTKDYLNADESSEKEKPKSLHEKTLELE